MSFMEQLGFVSSLYQVANAAAKANEEAAAIRMPGMVVTSRPTPEVKSAGGNTLLYAAGAAALAYYFFFRNKKATSSKKGRK